MNLRSKSTLFLMEQLIVIAVFAICAAACIKILAASYFLAKETRDISNAILIAESGAECYNAVAGNIGKVAGFLGGTIGGEDGAAEAIVYYDMDWLVCSEENALYELHLTSGSQNGAGALLMTGELSVEKTTGEEILSFPVAALAADLG